MSERLVALAMRHTRWTFWISFVAGQAIYNFVWPHRGREAEFIASIYWTAVALSAHWWLHKYMEER